MIKRLSPIWREPLVGKNLTLLRIEDKHKNFLLKTRQDKEFQHHYNLFAKDSEETIIKEIEIAKKLPLDIKKIEWIIEKNGKAIGIATLADLNMHNNTAELLFGFPGKKTIRDPLEAILLILEFAFCKIKLHKLTSYVYSDNEKAQKNTINIGFKKEGFLESHIYDIKSNKRLSLFVNGYLASSFFENTKLLKKTQKIIGRDLQPKKIKYSTLKIVK